MKHGIFMNTENSKTNEINLSIYYKLKNMYNNNEFKNSAPTCNGESDLPDGFYSI